jgi:hypothetical protein
LVTVALMATGFAATAAQATTNLVVNGDFSQGNVGFTSQYTYAAPTHGALVPEAVYTVAANPHVVHPNWIAMHDDNARLLVNGATSGPLTVWQESLATMAGQTYEFSASAADLCCRTPGDYASSLLEFEVSDDGFKTFQTLATLSTRAPGDAGRFKTVTAEFTATGAEDIRIVDAMTGRVGNDFAIDDISVIGAGGPNNGEDRSAPGTAGVVPEPGTWSLMIAGFGVLGAAVRQSRRRQTASSRFRSSQADMAASNELRNR